uniref:Uncharacterized protein LOC111131873 n=1 Tax=Crassostrea virginica TaxID=6565 RepID=A0A8B8E6N2_CRAVI|nr:uncharacterized protein LOC111131873 [Crassostrea virginica]
MASILGRYHSNAWKYPIDKFAPYELTLQNFLQRQIGSSWDFSRMDWDRACFVTDNFLRTILKELQNQAQRNFEGLVIRSDFIRQASARQGLKTGRPDEFDVLVPFEIEGLQLQEIRLTDISDEYLPGQIRLRVEDLAQIERYPSLRRAGVFEMNSGTCLVNTRALQEQVFKSLIDKAVHEENLKYLDVEKLCAMKSIPNIYIHIHVYKRKPTTDNRPQDSR